MYLNNRETAAVLGIKSKALDYQRQDHQPGPAFTRGPRQAVQYTPEAIRAWIEAEKDRYLEHYQDCLARLNEYETDKDFDLRECA